MKLRPRLMFDHDFAERLLPTHLVVPFLLQSLHFAQHADSRTRRAIVFVGASVRVRFVVSTMPNIANEGTNRVERAAGPMPMLRTHTRCHTGEGQRQLLPA